MHNKIHAKTYIFIVYQALGTLLAVHFLLVLGVMWLKCIGVVAKKERDGV